MVDYASMNILKNLCVTCLLLLKLTLVREQLSINLPPPWPPLSPRSWLVIVTPMHGLDDDAVEVVFLTVPLCC